MGTSICPHDYLILTVYDDDADVLDQIQISVVLIGMVRKPSVEPIVLAKR